MASSIIKLQLDIQIEWENGETYDMNLEIYTM